MALGSTIKETNSINVEDVRAQQNQLAYFPDNKKD